ncbi:MAG: carbohydrate kinase [Ornithinimicrobium sp.]
MPEGQKTRVVTVGEALIDIVHPKDSEPTEHVGGSPANVAVGLAALGHPTSLATYLGQDERGDRIADYLEQRNVMLTDGSRSAPRTSTAKASLDDDGGATYDFDLSWDIPIPDLTGVGHLHTGSIAATLQPGASTVFDAMSAARAYGTVSYDPNARPTIMGAAHEARSLIEERIGRSDVIKASAEDIEWLYAGATVEEVARLWGRLGPPLVVVTDGGEGALVHQSYSEQQVRVAAASVDVVDTVGAGDSFMAGLISGLLDAGLLGSLEARQRLGEATPWAVASAVDRALATAAYTVARAGAASPTRSDIDLPQSSAPSDG